MHIHKYVCVRGSRTFTNLIFPLFLLIYLSFFLFNYFNLYFYSSLSLSISHQFKPFLSLPPLYLSLLFFFLYPLFFSSIFTPALFFQPTLSFHSLYISLFSFYLILSFSRFRLLFPPFHIRYPLEKFLILIRS